MYNDISSLGKSVSDGKSLVATAITGKGVATASDATFATMATNINSIPTNTNPLEGFILNRPMIMFKTADWNTTQSGSTSETIPANCEYYACMTVSISPNYFSFTINPPSGGTYIAKANRLSCFKVNSNNARWQCYGNSNVYEGDGNLIVWHGYTGSSTVSFGGSVSTTSANGGVIACWCYVKL